MKPVCVLLLCVLAASPLQGANRPTYDMDRLAAFQRQLEKDKVTSWISSDQAALLLINKVDPVIRHPANAGHFMGTVVVSFELGRNGEVLHPMIMSGPKEFQKPVLAAVRRYQYRPYILNGEPQIVAASISIMAGY